MIIKISEVKIIRSVWHDVYTSLQIFVEFDSTGEQERI